MFMQWTHHLKNSEDKDRFSRTVQTARPVLSRLVDIIDEKEALLSREEIAITSFDKPNWEYRQAYNNGYRAALNRIKSFVDLDNQKNDTGEKL